MNGVQMYSTSSVGSSSSDSSRGTCRKTCRFRTVHLKRSSGSPTFGFSFRGGREFGTGFFISVVEAGSEAHLKGVKVGDQIVRINGLSVDNATHHEVLQLAQHHHHLTLSLKNVGLIPVKDSSDEPLTWRMVEQPLEPALISSSCDVDRVVIDAPEGAKLGCGICKGPDWRPGIFVQYTKPGSLARQAGLQPGDQILQCNRVSFTDIDFSFAVNVLKSTGTLDLILRKGSGIDLFPGESSGYSSASSTADEAVTLPASARRTNEAKRPNYNEPTASLTNRNPQRYSSSGAINAIGGKAINGDEAFVPVDRKSSKVPPPPPPRLPPLKSASSLDCLLDNAVVRRTDDALVTLRRECRYGAQTVVQISGPVQVEVHQEPSSLSSLENVSSSASVSSQASLSSAISQELMRRKERKQLTGESVVEKIEKPRKLVDNQSREHDLLIAELKRRQDNRMSAYQEATSTAPSVEQLPSLDSLDSPPPCPTPDYSDSSSSPQPSHTVKSSILRFEEKSKKTKSVTFGGSSTKEITPNKPRMDHEIQTQAEVHAQQTMSDSLDVVEMHSIDSESMVQPAAVEIKPPCTYFKPPARKDFTASPKRTTVIKITEYSAENKTPAKFEFLEPQRENETFDSELAKTLSKMHLRNNNREIVCTGVAKTLENNNNDVNGCKLAGSCGAPLRVVQNVTQDELSHVKKTLRTFEKSSSTNSIIVQIPKRT